MSVKPADIPIPNAIVLGQGDSRVLLGGQPTLPQLREIADAGYSSVINLRGAKELTGEDAPVCEALGLAYHHLPIDGAAGLSTSNVGAFHELLEGISGPHVVHCKSGNRVGALYALRAAWHQGASASEAMELGRRHGLTSLADAVEALLSRT